MAKAKVATNAGDVEIDNVSHFSTNTAGTALYVMDGSTASNVIAVFALDRVLSAQIERG